MRRGWLPGAAVLLAALFGGVAAAGPPAEAIRVPAAADRGPLGGDGRLADAAAAAGAGDGEAEAGKADEGEGEAEGRGADEDGAFWPNAIGALVCITVAALAAGLTMGMLSLDKMELQVLLETDWEDTSLSKEEAEQIKSDQQYAEVVLPVLYNRHVLLVTLLLMNSIANEALPLCLDKVVPNPFYALPLSVTFVLVFGEILPSAILTGPNQLYFAAKFVPLVRILRKIFFPISYPIAKLLDMLVGEEEEENMYNRAEVKALVSYLERENALKDDEVNLVHGAVSLHVVEAEQITMPMEKLFMLELNTVLDEECIARLMASGLICSQLYRRALQ